MVKSRDVAAHEENVRLWQETRSPAVMLEANQGRLIEAVNAHAAFLGRQHLTKDYEQAAAVGFLHAFEVKDWDPEQGTIGTFTHHWMRAMMQKDVDRTLGWVGISAPFSVVTAQRPVSDMPFVDSLSRPLRGSGNKVRHVEDVIPDPTDSYGEVVHRLALTQALDEVISRLDEPMAQWVRDWLHVGAERGAGPRLAKYWGVSTVTVFARIKAIRDLVTVEMNDIERPY